MNNSYTDWISYLEHRWAASVKDLVLTGKLHPYREEPIRQPIRTLFDQSTADALPTFSWSSRLEHLEHLNSS